MHCTVVLAGNVSRARNWFLIVLQVMGITDPSEFQRIAREYCKDMASEMTMPYYLRYCRSLCI
jgi:hypothetical protein